MTQKWLKLVWELFPEGYLGFFYALPDHMEFPCWALYAANVLNVTRSLTRAGGYHM